MTFSTVQQSCKKSACGMGKDIKLKKSSAVINATNVTTVTASTPVSSAAITPITPTKSVPTPGKVMANEEIETFLTNMEVDLSKNINKNEKKILLDIMVYSPIESLEKNPKNNSRNSLSQSRSYTPKCYQRYEGYKNAKTYKEFIVRGGTYGDFRWNFRRGFLKIHATTAKDEYVIEQISSRISSRITHRPKPPPIPNPTNPNRP